MVYFINNVPSALKQARFPCTPVFSILNQLPLWQKDGHFLPTDLPKIEFANLCFESWLVIHELFSQSVRDNSVPFIAGEEFMLASILDESCISFFLKL